MYAYLPEPSVPRRVEEEVLPPVDVDGVDGVETDDEVLPEPEPNVARREEDVLGVEEDTELRDGLEGVAVVAGREVEGDTVLPAEEVEGREDGEEVWGVCTVVELLLEMRAGVDVREEEALEG